MKNFLLGIFATIIILVVIVYIDSNENNNKLRVQSFNCEGIVVENDPTKNPYSNVHDKLPIVKNIGDGKLSFKITSHDDSKQKSKFIYNFAEQTIQINNFFIGSLFILRI